MWQFITATFQRYSSPKHEKITSILPNHKRKN